MRDYRGGELTYAQLSARAERVATTIATGRRAGSRCVLELEPGLEHAVALHGAILAGAVVQTIRPGLPASERELLLGDWPELVIDSARYDQARRRPTGVLGTRDHGLEQPLTRTITSGTTGVPRPVIHSAANHLWSASAAALNLGRRAEDRWLCCLPVDHVAGLAILLRSVLYGTAAIIHPGFDVDRVAAAIADEEATLISLVPTQLGRLLDAGAPLGRLRAILCGGAPVPREMLVEAHGRGARVIQTYGTTETCSQICTLAPEEAEERQGSAGRPLAGSRIEIIGGEILAAGPSIARDSLAADGFLHTGDRGRIDADGYLWVEGRLDDLIVSGGENVMPEEVEAALLSHPAVAEVGVAGVADPRWGQAVTAFVVASEGSASPEAEKLLEYCRGRLAPYKVPKRLSFVEELPRTPSGKLRRYALSPEGSR